VDPYVYNPQAALTSTAYYGPRFDYNPTTLAANGLLVEEQRSNLTLYSSDFTNAAWTKSNITFGTSITAPDGTTTAARLQATAATNTNVFQAVLATATSHTYSIYAKQGSGATDANTFGLFNNTTSTVLALLTINYGTGVITQSTGSGATATNVGDGFWRIVIPVTSGITVGNSINVYACFTGNPETAGEFAYAWGAQLEAGSFATSLIPTQASQVTRAADNASMLGDNFATWYRQDQGTFYSNADSYAENAGLNAYNIMSVNDGTISNYIRQYVYLNLTGGTVFSGGVSQADIGVAAWVRNVPFKNAFAYNTNSFNLAVNGTLGTPDTSGSVPTPVNRLMFGANNAAGGFLNGHIRSFSYYPVRLPAATLQAITQ
jgi:hypothetical protein